MKKYMSIDEFLNDYNQYPEAFNMLVPVQSIQDIGPMYKPIINMVFISIDPEEGDIYRQKNAKDPDGNDYKEKRYSISKKGLFQIYSAADARFTDTEQQFNVNKGMDLNTVTCKVSMQYHSFSGEWKTISDSKTVNRMFMPKAGK